MATKSKKRSVKTAINAINPTKRAAIDKDLFRWFKKKKERGDYAALERHSRDEGEEIGALTFKSAFETGQATQRVVDAMTSYYGVPEVAAA